MKYELPNIFLHFLEKDTQEILGIKSAAKSSIDQMQIALNAAVLLCKEYCILPVSSYFESENTKQLILNNLEYYRDGLIVFAMREDEIEEYQAKKQEQYKEFIHDVVYSRYFDKSEVKASKDLFRIDSTSLRRTTKIGEYCLIRWDENLSLFIDGYEGDISSIYNLDSITPGENAIAVALGLKEKAKRLEGGAFIWKVMAEKLDKLPIRDPAFERRARRFFQHNYYSAYLEEYDASILFDYLPFERKDNFMLKKKYLSASNYKWFKEYLTCLALDFILSCSATQILKIKRLPEFEWLMKNYLNICNSDSFSHQTDSIRKAVSDMTLQDGSQIKDLVNAVISEVSKMNDNQSHTYMTNDNSVVDVVIIIATADEEKAILSVCEWEKRTLKNGFDYFHSSLQSLSIALVRGAKMGKTSAGIIGQAAISELAPKYIAMVGFCAGQQGKVELGDVVVADKVYQYDTGKRVGKNKRLPDMDSFNLYLPWVHKVERFGDEWRKKHFTKQPPSYDSQKTMFIERLPRNNTVAFNPWEIGTKDEIPHLEAILDELINLGFLMGSGHDVKQTETGMNEFEKTRRKNEWYRDVDEPATKIGAIATGSEVQQWTDIFKILTEQYERKTIALDMESYAIAELAESNNRLPWIVAKGVGDYAKDGKALNNSLFVPFGCITSFLFVIEFLSTINRERGSET